MNEYTKKLNRRFKSMCERSEHIDHPVNTQRKHVSYSRKERYIQEDENKLMKQYRCGYSDIHKLGIIALKERTLQEMSARSL